MRLEPSSLSVFLDYKCNFACDHCSVGSSPETVFEMPEEVFEDAFEQAKEYDSIEQFVFTGGEVTLHKERLLEYIERVSDAGMKTRIVSNGWWAHDMESAREMVDDLVEAGLDEINTSYDDFHTEYMDAENIVNLIDASLERDELINVACAMILGDDPYWDKDRIMNRLDERLDRDPEEIPELHVLEDHADPMGRGAQLEHENYVNKADSDNACQNVINTVTVHPDGSIKACCGHAQFYQPDLTLGNVYDDPLPDILDRGTENLVYWLIHEVGPEKIINELDVEDDQEYTGVCHACNSLFGDYREEFFDYIRENRSELIQEEILLSDRDEERFTVLAENRDQIMEQIDQANAEKGELKPGDSRLSVSD